MEKIHILTDSSADIPQAQVDAYGIEVVPITLTHEGRAFTRVLRHHRRGVLEAAANQP